jgi:hypothetical protein
VPDGNPSPSARSSALPGRRSGGRRRGDPVVCCHVQHALTGLRSADIPRIPGGCGRRMARSGVLGNGKRTDCAWPRCCRRCLVDQLRSKPASQVRGRHRRATVSRRTSENVIGAVTIGVKRLRPAFSRRRNRSSASSAEPEMCRIDLYDWGPSDLGSDQPLRLT